MENEYNILKKIIEIKDGMPRKQKKFCEFILSEYREIGLDSISNMADKAEVGTTTILRTIKNLGYENFNDFKKDLHTAVLDTQTPKWWKFDPENSNDTGEEQIRSVWNKINMMQKYSLNTDLEKSILKAVSLMMNAEKIHVFGLRTSRAVAIYLENSINQFYPKCNQLSYEPHFIFDRLFHANEKETIILIALSPFTQLTYDVAEYCSEKNIEIILITDSMNNSMIPFAKTTLLLSRADEHFTLVPAMSLVETLTVILGAKVEEDSSKALEDVGSLIVRKNITKT
ncbi:MurR/RpiR family transcriptional regulator [Salinicoccus sp. ID82-1]|uniref:MurR/RpiR family transcriptional regulator n=1 Tax=Salinicoccus sp. ID82-1 TaxID=2820269 RepID=UPI001F3D84CD|nr:MurR/RpiR family transcriptional regulator [Salinicoccus sp. ID82-1]MCG1008832.1 MurR/RpiR family transcriptional regulator [Salinicoccus sp. ID82-1]